MYKAEIKKALHQMLIDFFNEERGNRVTSYNVNGLIGTLNSILQDNVIEEEEKKQDG